MAPVEEADSGMASQAASKDLTPEKATSCAIADDSDDDDLDETLAERLLGLTEMFPESVRNVSHSVCVTAYSGACGLYSLFRSSSWVIFSTATLLFAPVIFESERAQMEEMQKQQQRQILLGPNAAISGGSFAVLLHHEHSALTFCPSMHFWIDKRSQACSLSGRYRAPSGVASSRHRRVVWGGTGAGCCKVSGGGFVMVTPVHRFQPIESVQTGGGVRRAQHQRYQQRLLSQQGGASLLQSHGAATSRLQSADASLENSSQHENPDGVGRGGRGMSLLPQSSNSGLTSQQQVLLRLPAPRHDVLAVGNIKRGVWISLALILSVTGAVKFYTDHKGSGLEMVYMVLYMIMVLLLACCILTRCSNNSPRACFAMRSAQATSQNQDISDPRSALIEIPEEEAVTDNQMLVHHTQPWIQQQQQQQQQERQHHNHEPTHHLSQQPPNSTSGEPPPYHIAIWLPQPPIHIIPPAQQEMPPPSYDKATT